MARTNELEGARFQGRHVAQITARLTHSHWHPSGRQSCCRCRMSTRAECCVHRTRDSTYDQQAAIARSGPAVSNVVTRLVTANAEAD